MATYSVLTQKQVYKNSKSGSFKGYKTQNKRHTIEAEDILKASAKAIEIHGAGSEVSMIAPVWNKPTK
jgi:hypothetical protein